MATATAKVKNRQKLVLLAAIAIAFGVAACDRAADKPAATKAELMPTAPTIAPPPAQPAPVLPPHASAVFEPAAGGGTAPGAAASPAANATAQGGDPSAKEPMTKAQESSAMPMPAQANDHSTLTTDNKK